MFHRVTIAIQIIGPIGFAAALSLTLYHLVQMAKTTNRQRGSPFSVNVFANTFAVIESAADLTERGRVHRRWFFLSFVVLLCCILLMYLFGI
jgi:tellurite resistance protein TehA-like permease